MPTNKQYVIEFFGGPMDGHIEPIDEVLNPFVVFASRAPSRHGGLLTGLLHFWRRNRPRPSILAVYELHCDGMQQRYQHVRSIEATGIDIVPVGTQAVISAPKPSPLGSSSTSTR
ncbi:hypothetical protein Poly24_26650 [Rosistilla carotiformis]|uniref:Uncharacterized protein n=1 Tax=Rosistilla carotiformis TaxID=2528017 RepID=A0A518JTS2_9BACT|nr:hypothetical protein [Rosistilla carotiformis]QDV68952.1 hypothetical protein Poly24_26650 [Rosistilla carotiformis]